MASGWNISYRWSGQNGDRIAFGYELDATSHDGIEWNLSGDILIEKSEIALDQPISFALNNS